MTTILGINAFHGDASACLVRDGVLVAAAEEERFRRVKHWAGFPTEAIRWCLIEGGLDLSRVDHVAVNRDPHASRWERVLFTLRHRPGLGLVLDKLRNRRRVSDPAAHLRHAFPGTHLRASVHAIEHHLAHLASAAFVSPFERCLAVSVDQFGDFASTAWGPAHGSNLGVDGRISFPHSLGTFYSAMTQYLGFPHYGDEYKVMGLAPYGEPTHVDALRRVLRSERDGRFSLDLAYFRHHRDRVYLEWEGGQPQIQDLFSPALEELLGPRRAPRDPLEQRHKDLARSVQACYEQALFALLRALHAEYRLDDLALAGGCAMNSVANGKITRETPFRRVYVQAAAGDSGGAVGAAFALWYRLNPGPRRFVMDHAYVGPGFGGDEIDNLLRRRGEALSEAGCSIERLGDEEALCRRVAADIADGRVVGWFQGRMEWGPRALGNRSILGDPRRADMKDLLNEKIKRRESFRPFAPSILREAVGDWFEIDADVPFMSEVFPIRAAQRARVPAVTHVDGTGRLQTVTAAANPRYHRLIRAFEALTGVPMILNTSFNENEPVVCRPEEALDCFLRTRMDVLVLGERVIARERAGKTPMPASGATVHAAP